jgi:hypothetical protein
MENGVHLRILLTSVIVRITSRYLVPPVLRQRSRKEVEKTGGKMEPNRKAQSPKLVIFQSNRKWPGTESNCRHENFSPLAGARLCDTIGRYMYLFKRLTAVSARRFYRFEHIVDI